MAQNTPSPSISQPKHCVIFKRISDILVVISHTVTNTGYMHYRLKPLIYSVVLWYVLYSTLTSPPSCDLSYFFSCFIAFFVKCIVFNEQCICDILQDTLEPAFSGVTTPQSTSPSTDYLSTAPVNCQSINGCGN